MNTLYYRVSHQSTQQYATAYGNLLSITIYSYTLFWYLVLTSNEHLLLQNPRYHFLYSNKIMIVSLVLFQTNYNTILTQFIEMIYFKTYWFFCLLTKSLSGKYVFAAGKAAKTHTNVAINCTETKTDVMMSCDLYRIIRFLYFQIINQNLKFFFVHHI